MDHQVYSTIICTFHWAYLLDLLFPWVGLVMLFERVSVFFSCSGTLTLHSPVALNVFSFLRNNKCNNFFEIKRMQYATYRTCLVPSTVLRRGCKP